MFAYANINGVTRCWDSRSPSEVPYHCNMQGKQYKLPPPTRSTSQKYHILKMVSYPLIKEGQPSHKYAFLRASRAMLLRLGVSLKRVNGAIILENGLVPPCSILLPHSLLNRLLSFWQCLLERDR